MEAERSTRKVRWNPTLITREWDWKADFQRFADKGRELMFSGSGKLASLLRVSSFSTLQTAARELERSGDQTCLSGKYINGVEEKVDAAPPSVANAQGGAPALKEVYAPGATAPALKDVYAPGASLKDAYAPGDFAPALKDAYTPGATALKDAYAPGDSAPALTDAYALGAIALKDAYAPGAALKDAYAPGESATALKDASAPGEPALKDADAPGATALKDAYAPEAALKDAHAPGVFAPTDDVDHATLPIVAPVLVDHHPGLKPPELKTAPNQPVTGAQTKFLRKQNKQVRQQRQVLQSYDAIWKQQQGRYRIPTPKQAPQEYRNSMCPSGLALEHPAAAVLLEYASGGCPTKTGKNWTREMIEEAIARGPHVSATSAEAIAYYKSEIDQKVAAGQAKVVLWDDIKHNFPPELKISPLALVPHNSRKFRAILDLSFRLRLKSGNTVPSVNETSEKCAPQAACEQLGHVLNRIIHAFAEAAEDAKIFMAKFDIKDGFWRLDCAVGEEWNFAYVMPQEEGQPIRLVVPTSLQMGWIESPPFFCTASETGRDVAEDYVETPVGSLPEHKFEKYTVGGDAYNNLPATMKGDLKYLVEVYVDDFISLAIATSQEQLNHVARGVLQGIHDVFPANDADELDPIALKKLLKEDGKWLLEKEILGFIFDGNNKTIWLTDEKRQALLKVLKGWLRQSRGSNPRGIPFDEFQSVLSKIRHAFTAFPAGKGLLSHCNDVMRTEPSFIHLRTNKELYEAISSIRGFLHESIAHPTKCKQLVQGHPHYIGIDDASGCGVGGVILGERDAVVPTVFRLEWPQEIRDALVSFDNPEGSITNSDLEFVGLLLTWLVMEQICPDLVNKHVALWSDNQPSVCWLKRMASKNSYIAKCILQIIALRQKIRMTSPLTPQHIKGEQNSITDIPSRSFGSKPEWHFKSHMELLTFFNKRFPLPQQNSWTVFQISNRLSTKVISLLLTRHFVLDEWRRLPPIGKHIGDTGKPTAALWEWTLTFRIPQLPTVSEQEHSQVLQHASEVASMEEDAKSKLTRHVALSRPLGRPSRWTQGSTQPKKTTEPKYCSRSG
eukprot:scaffold1721_cov105-Skeletonema_menzelii.AAC.2